MPNNQIAHVVVLMLENRSFDHVFGFRAGVNGLKGDEVNLSHPLGPASADNRAFAARAGAPFAVPVGKGPEHSLNATSVQVCGDRGGPSGQFPARNNGFVKNYVDALHHDHVRVPTEDQIAVVMQAFEPQRLPTINALADAFCLCDNWHSEVPGPTQPNRLYIHMATSAGYAHNDWQHLFDQPTIYTRLRQAGKTWRTYDSDVNEVKNLTQANDDPANFKRFPDFAADARAGDLPNYTFIVPRMFNADEPANDQHAPHDVRFGEHLIADVYEALVSNPAAWAKTVLVVTYDEHGGFYDHVVPPADNVPNPDGINSPAPDDRASFAPKFAFDRLGLRVPAVIASPWVKKGRVDSTRYQHTSVLATLKNLFGLPEFLTRRDASAAAFDGLLSELDAPRTDWPRTLPRPALPPIPTDRDDPNFPGNQPLDDIQQEILNGVAVLGLREGVASDAVPLPTTQGAAADFIRDVYDQMLSARPRSGKS